jgi:hypothetical protein
MATTVLCTCRLGGLHFVLPLFGIIWPLLCIYRLGGLHFVLPLFGIIWPLLTLITIISNTLIILVLTRYFTNPLQYSFSASLTKALDVRKFDLNLFCRFEVMKKSIKRFKFYKNASIFQCQKYFYKNLSIMSCTLL